MKLNSHSVGGGTTRYQFDVGREEKHAVEVDDKRAFPETVLPLVRIDGTEVYTRRFNMFLDDYPTINSPILISVGDREKHQITIWYESHKGDSCLNIQVDDNPIVGGQVRAGQLYTVLSIVSFLASMLFIGLYLNALEPKSGSPQVWGLLTLLSVAAIPLFRILSRQAYNRYIDRL